MFRQKALPATGHPTRTHAGILPRHPHIPRQLPLLVVVVAAVVLVLVAAESLLLTSRSPNVRLVPNSNEADYVLRGFHAAEQDRRSHYRWSSGEAQLRFEQFGSSSQVVFGLNLGPPPLALAGTQARLDYGDSGGTHTVQLPLPETIQPRHYRLLVPPAATTGDNLVVNLASETTVLPPDTRNVGLRVEEARLVFLGSPRVGVAPRLIVVQSVLLLLLALLLSRLNASLLLTTTVLLLVAGAVVLLYRAQMLLVYPYLLRLMVAVGVLVALTYGLLPLACRYAGWLAPPPLMRVLWGITVLACLIRLGGSFYPLFDAYDLSLNVDRLLKTISGMLVVTNNSIEFRNGITVYPPGPYLVLLPGMLAHIPPNLLVMGGIGIIDGAGALLVAGLARTLGANSRTMVFSALLYAAIPIHLTALWWGLTAQIFGQALMLPLAIALLLAVRHPRTRTWAAAGMFLTMSLFSHIGVAIVAVAWLGLTWVLMGARRTLVGRDWWSFTWMLVLSGVAGLLFVYSNVAVLMIEQFFQVGQKVATSDYVPAYWLIYRGFQIAFHELGFWLLVPGLLLVWRRTLPPGGHDMIAGWLGTVAVFWGIEMVSALQVRYIYFLTPLACIGIGLLLDKLAVRGRVGRAVAWGVAVLLLLQGTVSWYTSTFADLMMSVSPLLR